MGLVSKIKKIFNSNKPKKSEDADKDEMILKLIRMIKELKSEYQEAISANNSMLTQIKNINNNVKGNVLKAHKKNKEEINKFIESAIEVNCEKNAEIQKNF